MAACDDIRSSAKLLQDATALRRWIQYRLHSAPDPSPFWDAARQVDAGVSAVLFLLGMHRRVPGRPPEPFLILNKRSTKVRQPGDICCPGGGVAPSFDRIAAHLLRLPLSPLRRWAYYSFWQRHAPGRLTRLRLLLATALREGAEEMRLNPLAVRFQGILPAEQLVMFRRTIVPMVAWVSGQRRFYPNWEVEKIIRIPLRELLSPEGYVRLRLRMMTDEAEDQNGEWKAFPAFRHRCSKGDEILWGATFRITMGFLQRVFAFTPPDPAGTAVIEKHLTSDYLTGRQ